MRELPCISLWQPWASALFLVDQAGDRIKHYETRHWPAPSRLIGKRVAIHAAKRAPPAIDVEAEGVLHAYSDPNWRTLLPRGAIIGTAVLAGSVQMDELMCEQVPIIEGLFGHWEPGRFAWRMDDPELLPNPIPSVGRQSWFTVSLPEAADA